jgi:membrane-associated phospholipid phosphatase
LALTLLFLLTYGGTNWLASMRQTRFHIYFSQELAIPFVPWMIWAYLSLQVFFVLPLLVLNSAGLSRFGLALALATIVAAAIHLMLPADLGWARPDRVPGYPVFTRFFSFDRPHNLVPSLHVAYSALTCLVVWNATRSHWMRWIASFWTALLLCSVLLIHQHHLTDIASGLVLAAICFRWYGRHAS